MNITLDKQSATDGIIKIALAESDYQPKVEEKTKEYARKANIKGFRQGKVPSGVIKKMYGKSILVEEVNHIVSHAVSDYIRDQKLRILGDPMPNQEKAFGIDWDSQKDFEFEFQIGLVEDFSVDLSPKVKVKSYPITVDQAVIDETIEDVKQRFGNVTYPEVSEAGCNLFGEISKVGETEHKGSYILIDKVAKKEQKKFIGLKKEDTVEFDIEKAFDDVKAKAQALNVAEEEAENITGKYTFKVTTVSKVEPAEINQQLFDKVFGPNNVTSEEAFIEKIKSTISENYQRETEHMLDHEIQHYYVDHTNITMPENFLKTWLKNSSNGEVTDSVLEKEFNAYRDSLKWDLIKNKIAEEKEIKVEGEEVREKAKQFIMEQFGGPAIASQLGDKLNDIANNYLSGQDGKGENFMKIYNQLRNEKILKTIKENITVTEKPVSLEEFKKHAETHRH
ncbi:MAG: trigger factor [Cyclobacteriaceae bacterium]|nr:MAG: trigger factor [Cyclobacteriaceae bacterium]